MREYAVICYSGASRLQYIPGVKRTWSAFLYSFSDGCRISVKKIGESAALHELIQACAAAFGSAYRYGSDWTLPDWSSGKVPDAAVRSFINSLEKLKNDEVL